MPFVPNRKNRIGDTIILTEDKKTMVGVFISGTEMKVMSRGDDRGYNLQDNEGNNLLEVGWDLDSFSKPK